MRKRILTALGCLSVLINASAQSFTPGNLVVLQTAGTTSKAGSQATLKEFTTGGVAGISVAIPVTGITPFQSAGVYGGSEGFLTTAADGKFLVLGGYGTSATFSDITGTLSTAVPRVVGVVYPSGYYLQIDTSNTFYSANDIRGAISDGTNFWAGGASNNNIDGINYFNPGAHVALAAGSAPPKAYGLRIFNGQIYYSTQKAGPSNTGSQLGIFSLGTGLPTSGTVSPTQVINTGSNVPEDFSFNAAGDVCYVAINQNNAAGGIQKWTKSGTTWSLAYTLGTGTASVGAYGLVVDYSGANPVVYATTFESAGNRVISIVDNGAAATATTLIAATSNTYYKGISFAPVAYTTPVVNLSVSTDTASEAGATVVTVSATLSSPVNAAQTIALGVSGTGITAGDYILADATLTIPSGATSASTTFTVQDDILGEGTEIATITMSNPSSGIALGMKATQNISIADNDANNHPVIAMSVDSTTNLIDGGITTAPATPFKVSGVMADPTDPATTLGINFMVTDLETASTGLMVNIQTSNATVVPLTGISLTGTDSLRNLKITPAAVGYADITLTVNDGTDSTSYIINYAASAASVTPSATIWPTGMSDASDAIALDDSTYISGDDELNILNVYPRQASGMPMVSYGYSSTDLALPDPAKPEADLEAATRSTTVANRIYWLGSMSNGKAPFDNKPNRDRIFATNVTGTGAATSFSFVGYGALKASILTWGDAQGYDFTTSAAAGIDSKQDNGFAAEAMVFAPDSTTLYIGLRAPLVPVTARKNALIVPVQHFETWFNNGTPSGTPTFGAPIELNLGGRGLRDMIRLSNGTYIIIAGNVGGSPITGAIYKWSGLATDTAILVNSPASDTLNMEGVMGINTAGTLSLTSLQVVTDKGDDVLYNDGVSAKDFNDLAYRKFRSDILTGLDLTMPVPSSSVSALTGNQQVAVYPNPANEQLTIAGTTTGTQVQLFDVTGRQVYKTTTNQTTMKLATKTLVPGTYLLQLTGSNGLRTMQKVVISR